MFNELYKACVLDVKLPAERSAIKFLKKFIVRDPYDSKSVSVPLLERDDGVFVSAEHENSWYFADYYGEFRGGSMWINPDLEKGLSAFGFFLEWVNPGLLRLCKI